MKPYVVCSLVLLLALPAGAHAGEPSLGQARDRVDDLIHILEAPSSSYKVQLLTMAYLGRFHDRRAVPALGRMLDRGRPAVRRLAVTALGQIGAPEAMAVLHGLARSNRHRLGALARRAIQLNINERLAPPTSGPRVRIAAGRFSNHTGQGGRDLGRLLGQSMIASFASHHEVAIAALRDPAGITTASVEAGYVLDGAIVRLDWIRIGDRQRLVCHIRVCVATNPGGSMKAFYRGEATVEASARQPLVELQHEVVQGAAREATRRILHSHLFQQTRPVL